ncbi:MAG: hypothetical protein WDW36_010007 [Sanguina aurantia]
MPLGATHDTLPAPSTHPSVVRARPGCSGGALPQLRQLPAPPVRPSLPVVVVVVVVVAATPTSVGSRMAAILSSMSCVGARTLARFAPAPAPWYRARRRKRSPLSTLPAQTRAGRGEAAGGVSDRASLAGERGCGGRRQ